MKKILSILLCSTFLLFLVACQEPVEPTTLDVPGNINILSEVLSFDEVPHATRYRIEAESLSDGITRRYFVTNPQNIGALFFPPGQYRIKLQATGDQVNYLDSEFSEVILYTQIDPFLINSLSGEFLLDPLSVSWMGRTYYNELTQTQHFYFTASGFEVKFYGTELSAELVTGANPAGKEPHLVVFLDGETDPRLGTLIVMDKPRGIYTLVSGLPEGEHTVRVLKRSESIDSTTGLIKLDTDGYFMRTPELRSRRIEVIAASSSAGFGNLAANTNEAKTTQNSDGLRAYAFLASRMLNAEINIFSASGWPLLRGPWTGTNNIPTAYDFVNVYSTNAWSHQNYRPDVVVINLGTNDWSYISSLSGSARTEAITNFENAFVEFIKKINQIHPDATIVIAYGLMNETNIYTPTLNAVTKARLELPSVNIFDIKLASVNAADGIGSSNHPSLKTHIKAAQELADAISEWMDWNIVRQNITAE